MEQVARRALHVAGLIVELEVTAALRYLRLCLQQLLAPALVPALRPAAGVEQAPGVEQHVGVRAQREGVPAVEPPFARGDGAVEYFCGCAGSDPGVVPPRAARRPASPPRPPRQGARPEGPSREDPPLAQRPIAGAEALRNTVSALGLPAPRRLVPDSRRHFVVPPRETTESPSGVFYCSARPRA